MNQSIAEEGDLKVEVDDVEGDMCTCVTVDVDSDYVIRQHSLTLRIPIPRFSLHPSQQAM
jgi:hypothetical protein